MENPLDKLDNTKAQSTNVQGHTDAKTKGEALTQTIKELSMGGGAILLLGGLAQLMFPFWVSAVAAFWVGFWVCDSAGKSYVYGFVAMLLMWSVYAGIQSSANGGLITTAFSNVFGGKLNGGQLIAVTGFVGGLVGGFSAMSGTLFRHIFKKEVA